MTIANKLLASLAGVSDIYTDAPECAASVAQANNLAMLAGIIAESSGTEGDTELTHGEVLLDGVVIDNDATIFVDGYVSLTDDEMEIPQGGLTFRPHGTGVGAQFRLELIGGDDESDGSLVLDADDAEAFYLSALRVERERHRTPSSVKPARMR